MAGNGLDWLQPCFTTPGKHSAWIDVFAGKAAEPVRLPITVVHKGAGPRVLFTGGNHGDEYEGPIAIHRIFSRNGG